MEKELINVQVDGKEVLVSKDSPIEEALNLVGVEDIGSIVAIIEEAPEEIVKKVKQFEILTTRGSLYIEISEKFMDLVRDIFPSIRKLKNIWSNPRSVGFGYFTLKLKPSKMLFPYDKRDISIGFLGFEQDKGCIIFMKDKHKAFYGASSDIPVLGKVIRGKNILNYLDKNDSIEEIRPVTYELPIKRAKVGYKIVKPGKIFTKIKILLSEASPIGSEHILALFQNKKYFESSDSTSVYIKDSHYSGVSILSSYQLQERRKETVTIRVKGEDIGSVYIYKKTVFPSKYHLYVGDVIFGMELVEVTEKGDKIPISISPKRVNSLGMNQRDAGVFLNSLGIKQVRKGIVDDDAIIVEQDPYYTLKIHKKRVVKTIGINKKEVVKIELYDKVDTITLKYFEMCSGLLYDKIGKLTIQFLNPDFIIFKEKCILDEPLTPKNPPKNIVNAFEIGVSNMSSKFMGLIGIRLKPSEKYGPTGEKFNATNIIGNALEFSELIKNKKEGDIICVRKLS